MPATWVVIDLERRTLSFRFPDGRQTSLPMPASMFAEPANLQRVELDVDAAQAFVTMPGERALVELRDPRRSLEELRAARKIVYLDQNHWSTLAAARRGHRPVGEAERRAALRLGKLAEGQRILLPASAGHFVETTPLHGARRVALAGTVLALSRGWQMRNPLHIRVEEMLRAVHASAPAAADVFAPGADEIFASPQGLSVEPDRSDGAAQPGAPAKPAAATALEQVGSLVPAVLGLYEAFIDEEAIPDEGGMAQAAAESWARGFAELASMLRDAGEPASTVRRVASARMLVDMMDDVTRVASAAGITPSAVVDRLTADDDPVMRMPFLAQMRQMLFARLRNADQAWESNDLADVMFLCCAAGYADLVVGERQAIGYLRQARLPRPRACLTATLQEALEALEALGVLSDSR